MFFRLAILSLLFCWALAEERTSYEGYKVYQVIPTQDAHAQFLKSLPQNYDVDFWTELRNLGENVDIMVSPASQKSFEEALSLYGIDYSIMLEDVERVIETERETVASQKRDSRSIVFNQYYNHSEINDYLRELQAAHPDIVELETIGTSLEGRELVVAKLSLDRDPRNPVILIDGGIHAREWVAPAVVIYLIQALVEYPEYRYLLEYVDWHLLPVLNPDGYAYTISTTRLWRKTRSHGNTCYGVDGNRNFDYFWGTVGASASECDETYRGPIARSEIETRLLENFAREYALRTTLYLSFHSYGNYILYPWGFVNSGPDNTPELQELGDAAANAIRAYNSSTIYSVGVSSTTLYATSGSSVDWIYGALGVPLSYTVELPARGAGFVLPPSNLESVFLETFEGVKVFANYTRHRNSRIDW